MDGVLIDSEPLWQEAGKETLQHFGISLTDEQYHTSTGLRTEEWVDHWFGYFGIDRVHAPEAVRIIIRTAIEKIGRHGTALPGVNEILDYFEAKQFRIGLATSSPMDLVDVVVDKLGIRNRFNAFCSAEFLTYGKPHPQVFLDCAAALSTAPPSCIVFEDSFNGMIAAKAARMNCVVVPAGAQYDQPRWGAADRKLKNLAAYIQPDN